MKEPRELLTSTTAMSRRALLALAGIGAATLAGGPLRRRSSEAVAHAETVTAPACVLSPEQTQGPYYIAREKVRRNIRENRHGTPLKLRLTVVDATTCRAIKGAAVDVWHCDAGGIYSGFVAASEGGAPGGNGGPTDTHTFLRGVQLTDAHGRVEFDTIYPGWYHGRTVHIHVKVHAGGENTNAVHTGQLYFDDSLTAKVYEAQPYKVRASERDTFNNTDAIFQNGGRQSMLHMTHTPHGYVGTITLGVRR